MSFFLCLSRRKTPSYEVTRWTGTSGCVNTFAKHVWDLRSHAEQPAIHAPADVVVSCSFVGEHNSGHSDGRRGLPEGHVDAQDNS